MDVYRTDEQQVESLREWWKENGTSVMFGIVLGVAGIFGWRAWQAYEVDQAEAASALYQQMTVAMQQSDHKKAEGLASRIADEYPSTGYAIFAKGYQARRAVDAGDLDGAAAHIEWAIEQEPEPSMKRGLLLNLARVRAAQSRHDEALALLNAGDAGEYAGSYDELRGDIQIQKGDAAAARSAYERALAAAQAKKLDTAILELKLDNLGSSSGS